MLLIINKSRKNAETVSDICYYIGIISNTTTPERAYREVSNRYRAILVMDPERICSLPEILELVRKYSLGAPVFAFCEADSRADINYLSTLFDKVFFATDFSARIIKEIVTYQLKYKYHPIGNYSIMGIDASIFATQMTFFNDPIFFTKTETMIIRYLFCCYPNPATASDILKFAFKNSKLPELSNIRTHISVINKKFKAIANRPLIVSEPRKGYFIFTPVIERELEEKRRLADATV